MLPTYSPLAHKWTKHFCTVWNMLEFSWVCSPGLAPGTTMLCMKQPPGCNSWAACHLFKQLSSWETQKNRRKEIMRHDRKPHDYKPEAFGRVLFSQTSKQTKGPGKSELLGVSRRSCEMPLLRYKEETNCWSTFMKWKQRNILTAKFYFLTSTIRWPRNLNYM